MELIFETIKNINRYATGALKPDLTVLLDIPVSEGFARKTGQEPDRFEKEAKAFHQRVRKGYLQPGCRRTAALAGYRCQAIERKN